VKNTNQVTHTCGCNPKKPCSIAATLFGQRRTKDLAVHIERTMLIDGIPLRFRQPEAR
jgi:hypothetical protein